MSMISRLNGRFGNLSVMSVSVFHASMRVQSGSALTLIYTQVSRVTSTTPSGFGGSALSLATSIRGVRLCAFSDTVTFSKMSSSRLL